MALTMQEVIPLSNVMHFRPKKAVIFTRPIPTTLEEHFRKIFFYKSMTFNSQDWRPF